MTQVVEPQTRGDRGLAGDREATIYGSGTLANDVPVLFRIEVTDGGKGGKADKYGILLSTGYYSGEQPLRGGNITVRY